MNHPVGVVAVMVCEHDLSDVGRRESRGGKRSGQLLLDRDVEARERNVSRRRGLARVDEQERPIVLDCPAMNRHGLRPGAWKTYGTASFRNCDRTSFRD
jgi:hypothetical protein